MVLSGTFSAAYTTEIFNKKEMRSANLLNPESCDRAVIQVS